MDHYRLRNSASLFTLFGIFFGYAAANLTSWDTIFDNLTRYIEYTLAGGVAGLVIGLAIGLSKWGKVVVESDEETENKNNT